MLDVLNELIRAIGNCGPVALATIIDVQGASPAQVGFKPLIWHDGRCVGNVGGGELEKHIREAAREALAKGSAAMIQCSLREEGEDAIGMLWGGCHDFHRALYDKAGADDRGWWTYRPAFV